MANNLNSIGHYVESVKPGLWRIVFHLPTSTNCWLVEEDDGLTLIDAGNYWNGGTILNTTKVLGKPLRRILITHAHPDHAGAAAQLVKETGAVVCAHEDDVPFLTGRGSLSDLPGSNESRTLHRTAHWIGILQPPKVASVKVLQDGDTIGSLKVLHTPGHTPGSISFWSDSHKGIFVGDNASYRLKMLRGNLSWFTLNTNQLKKSISAYSSYPAELLLPGHGPAYHSPSAVADLLNAISN